MLATAYAQRELVRMLGLVKHGLASLPIDVLRTSYREVF